MSKPSVRWVQNVEEGDLSPTRPYSQQLQRWFRGWYFSARASTVEMLGPGCVEKRHWSNENKTVVWDDTTQLCGDYNKPL